MLQTLLAGLPDVRMSLDPKTNKIIALARPSEHRTIQETIRQLEGECAAVRGLSAQQDGRQDDGRAAINKFFPTKEGDYERDYGGCRSRSTLKLLSMRRRGTWSGWGRLSSSWKGRAGEGGSSSTLRFIPHDRQLRRLGRGDGRAIVARTQPDPLTAPSETGPGIFELREDLAR